MAAAAWNIGLSGLYGKLLVCHIISPLTVLQRLDNTNTVSHRYVEGYRQVAHTALGQSQTYIKESEGQFWEIGEDTISIGVQSRQTIIYSSDNGSDVRSARESAANVVIDYEDPLSLSKHNIPYYDPG